MDLDFRQNIITQPWLCLSLVLYSGYHLCPWALTTTYIYCKFEFLGYVGCWVILWLMKTLKVTTWLLNNLPMFHAVAWTSTTSPWVCVIQSRAIKWFQLLYPFLFWPRPSWSKHLTVVNYCSAMCSVKNQSLPFYGVHLFITFENLCTCG